MGTRIGLGDEGPNRLEVFAGNSPTRGNNGLLNIYHQSSLSIKDARNVVIDGRQSTIGATNTTRCITPVKKEPQPLSFCKNDKLKKRRHNAQSFECLGAGNFVYKVSLGESMNWGVS